MSDLLLDTDTHDLVIENNDLVITEDTHSIAQRVKMTLLTFKGEWYQNTEFGTPYFQSILVKGNEDLAPVLLQNVINKVPGVTRITSFNASLDTNKRKLTLVFSVQVSTSEEVEININL